MGRVSLGGPSGVSNLITCPFVSRPLFSAPGGAETLPTNANA